MPNEAAVERVARAMEGAEFAYSMRLTRLVDEESTYTLTYSDTDEVFTFDDIDDGYAHIAQRKRETQARAAIAEVMAILGEPTDAMRQEAKEEHVAQEGIGGFRSDQALEVYLAALRASPLSEEAGE